MSSATGKVCADILVQQQQAKRNMGGNHEQANGNQQKMATSSNNSNSNLEVECNSNSLVSTCSNNPSALCSSSPAASCPTSRYFSSSHRREGYCEWSKTNTIEDLTFGCIILHGGLKVRYLFPPLISATTLNACFDVSFRVESLHQREVGAW